MNLSVQSLRVAFGTVQALDGIDASMASGRVTVLVGPNGAGKSTLLSVLLGLVQPQSGTLTVDGERLPTGPRLPRAFRERMGYLPEAVAFTETLSGLQVLSFFARARGVGTKRVHEVLERVGLGGAATRKVRGYSRGMRQRLGLAIAILHEPELLILDEPTGGLDQKGLGLLWEVLAEWRQAGRTAVVSTHDLALIERRADDMIVLSHGQILAAATPDALRRSVDLPVTVRLELDDIRAAAALTARLRAQGATDVHHEGGRVAVSCREADLLSVLQAAQIDAHHVQRTRIEEPGLDDVYDHLLLEASC